MTLNQLRTFCTLVEEGSFTRTAERLYLSQPSISQHIAALEKRYDVSLFSRKGRKITLTPEGKALHSLALELLDKADAIPQKFREMQTLKYGKLDIGVTPFSGSHILPSALVDFRLHYPSIKVSVISDNNHNLLDSVEKGNMELAILERNPNCTPATNINYLSLGTDRFVLALPPDHPWRNRAHINPQDLSNETFILYQRDCSLFQFIHDYIFEHKIAIKKEIRVENADIAKALVCQGVGIAFMNISYLDSELASGEISPIALEGMEQMEMEKLCVYNQTRGLSYAGWNFRKILEQKAKGAETRG